MRRRDDITVYGKQFCIVLPLFFMPGCMTVFCFFYLFQTGKPPQTHHHLWSTSNDSIGAGYFSQTLCLPLNTICTLECSCSPGSSPGCSHLFPIPLSQATRPSQLYATIISPLWNSTIHNSSDAGMQFFYSSLHSEVQPFSNPYSKGLIFPV